MQILYAYVPGPMRRVIRGTERQVSVTAISTQGLLPGAGGLVWATSMRPEEFCAWRIGGEIGFDVTLRDFPTFLRKFRKRFSDGGYVIEIRKTSSFRRPSAVNWKRYVGQYYATETIGPKHLVIRPLLIKRAS